MSQEIVDLYQNALNEQHAIYEVNLKNIIARELKIKRGTSTFRFFLVGKIIFLFRFSKNVLTLFEIRFEEVIDRLVRKEHKGNVLSLT